MYPFNVIFFDSNAERRSAVMNYIYDNKFVMGVGSLDELILFLTGGKIDVVVAPYSEFHSHQIAHNLAEMLLTEGIAVILVGSELGIELPFSDERLLVIPTDVYLDPPAAAKQISNLCDILTRLRSG